MCCLSVCLSVYLSVGLLRVVVIPLSVSGRRPMSIHCAHYVAGGGGGSRGRSGNTRFCFVFIFSLPFLPSFLLRCLPLPFHFSSPERFLAIPPRLFFGSTFFCLMILYSRDHRSPLPHCMMGIFAACVEGPSSSCAPRFPVQLLVQQQQWCSSFCIFRREMLRASAVLFLRREELCTWKCAYGSMHTANVSLRFR